MNVPLGSQNNNNPYAAYNAGWLLIFTVAIVILVMVVYFIILATSFIKNNGSFYFANDFNLRSDRSFRRNHDDGVLTNDRPIYIYENELSKFKKNIEPTAPPYSDLPKIPDDAEEHIYDVPETRQKRMTSPVSDTQYSDSDFTADDEEEPIPQKTDKKIYENFNTRNENIYLTPKSNKPV